MSEPRTIGEVLRQLREERGELLREVANDPRLDIDPTLLSHIENGRRVPTPPQLEGLAAHYGLPVEELMPYVDTSLNRRARSTWGRRSRSDVPESATPPVAASVSSSRAFALASQGPEPGDADLADIMRSLAEEPAAPTASAPTPAPASAPAPVPTPAPAPADEPRTIAEALGMVETSSELAVDGLAETADTALDRLRQIAEDASAPRPMRRRAQRALEWLRSRDRS